MGRVNLICNWGYFNKRNVEINDHKSVKTIEGCSRP